MTIFDNKPMTFEEACRLLAWIVIGTVWLWMIIPAFVKIFTN